MRAQFNPQRPPPTLRCFALDIRTYRVSQKLCYKTISLLLLIIR